MRRKRSEEQLHEPYEVRHTFKAPPSGRLVVPEEQEVRP